MMPQSEPFMANTGRAYVRSLCKCGQWCIHKSKNRLLALSHPLPYCEFFDGEFTRQIAEAHPIYKGVLGSGIYTDFDHETAAI